jgi:nickel-dependent lactate racemase
VSVVGRAVEAGHLPSNAVARTVREGLASLAIDGQRVLALVPDGTRTMPMPLVFEALQSEIASRAAAMDVLVALGTHQPMSDAQLGRLLGHPVANGLAGRHRVFNHRWDDPRTFVTLGTIPAREILELTAGHMSQDVPVALNRLVLDYDHILVCGPVFPHEVVGFSGGTKYLFPGIAAPEIIHFTHWLGALITSSEVIGTIDTPVRAVIDRAASLLDRPVSLLALVAEHDGVFGVFCGGVHEAWRQAATVSARHHISWLDKPRQRVIAIMPEMYDDLWTAAKGVYKTEPIVAEGGEIYVYAPHVREISYVHGRLIREIGYHCRDYFLAQWERFGSYPGGILAHSTHVKGLGTYDPATRIERPRIDVILATGIPEDVCRAVNLGYRAPEAMPFVDADNALVVSRAGERLFRLGRPPELPEDAA